MGLTERHLLNDEGGAWEPIGGWSDKPNLSIHPQPVCCQSIFPQGMYKGFKYPRKEYITLLDVMYQAIGDYKEAVDKPKELEERGPEIKKIERQINFISWMLAYITEVMNDES